MNIYSPDFIPVTQMALYSKASIKIPHRKQYCCSFVLKKFSVFTLTVSFWFFIILLGKFSTIHIPNISFFCQGTLISPSRPEHEGVQTKDDVCTLVY